jgi:hypothetical protein
MACGEVAFLILGVAAILMYGLFKMRGVELLKNPADPAAGALLVSFGKLSWAYVAAAVALTAPVKAKLLAMEP